MNQINVQLIEDFIKKNHLTKTSFCRLCKISLSRLHSILSGKDIYISALFRIANIMNIRVCELFC